MSRVPAFCIRRRPDITSCTSVEATREAQRGRGRLKTSGGITRSRQGWHQCSAFLVRGRRLLANDTVYDVPPTTKCNSVYANTRTVARAITPHLYLFGIYDRLAADLTLTTSVLLGACDFSMEISKLFCYVYYRGSRKYLNIYRTKICMRTVARRGIVFIIT